MSGLLLAVMYHLNYQTSMIRHESLQKLLRELHLRLLFLRF